MNGGCNMCHVGHFKHTLVPKCCVKHALCGFIVEPVLDVALAVWFNTNPGLVDLFGGAASICWPQVMTAGHYACCFGFRIRAKNRQSGFKPWEDGEKKNENTRVHHAQSSKSEFWLCWVLVLRTAECWETFLKYILIGISTFPRLRWLQTLFVHIVWDGQFVN